MFFPVSLPEPPPLTSSVNEVPPFPMAATLPATDFVGCCVCFSDCAWAFGGLALAALLIPRANKATEIPQRNFRIVELGISLLVMGGRVWIAHAGSIPFSTTNQNRWFCSFLTQVHPIRGQ